MTHIKTVLSFQKRTTPKAEVITWQAAIREGTPRAQQTSLSYKAARATLGDEDTLTWVDREMLASHRAFNAGAILPQKQCHFQLPHALPAGHPEGSGPSAIILRHHRWASALPLWPRSPKQLPAAMVGEIKLH